MSQGIHTTEIELEPQQQRRVAARLATFVEKHGSHGRAAVAMGISPSLFSKLILARRSERFSRPETLDKIAKACAITRDVLIYGNAELVR